MSKIIIVGGVAAGASCAARLRRLNEENEIILLEKGPYISFANCGLPYYVGNVIQKKSDLLLQTPEVMKARFHIDVRIQNEVLSIQPKDKTLTIMDHNTNKEYKESYDTLVLATGSSPLKPNIPGIDSNYIKSLWTVMDAERIKQDLDQEVESVAVIGGDFIGLEMADNLHHAGKKVTLIEASPQVMAPLDKEMAEILHKDMRKQGVELILEDAVTSFEEREKGISIHLASGKVIESDLVILSIGVRPNSKLAKESGLAINDRGGIIVDEYLRTSDPNIFAAGDVIEVEDFISKDKTMIPLAGPANKQGRIIADTLSGNPTIYKGTQGTSIAKVFSFTAASTGHNEKQLQKAGLKKDIDYKTILIRQNSHAGYYPGAMGMMLKLIFSLDGQKIYGAQIVGNEGVDKRIDTLSTSLRLNATIEDLKYLELSYAPPYSSAKDPVNMLGFVAENAINGMVEFSSYDIVEKNQDICILDVREKSETDAYAIDGSLFIPLGELRERIEELDREKEYVIFCAIGVRAYNASCILKNHGFNNVKVYPGGMTYYRLTH